MPELHTLKNEQLTVTASSFGAELQSVTGADGVEYLWNGDPAYWAAGHPICFPSSAPCGAAGPPVPKGRSACRSMAWPARRLMKPKRPRIRR